MAAQKDKYVVRKIVREKGTVEWIEREFAWRVDMKEKSIRVISLAAQQFMPLKICRHFRIKKKFLYCLRSFERVGQFG